MPMADADSILRIIDEMQGITDEIKQLLAELRPVADQIETGRFDSATADKNKRLQDRIGKLHERREDLKDRFSD